jgi:hypothetical protein
VSEVRELAFSNALAPIVVTPAGSERLESFDVPLKAELPIDVS